MLTVHREFVGQGENAFWALAVEYLDGPVPARGGAAAGDAAAGAGKEDKTA